MKKCVKINEKVQNIWLLGSTSHLHCHHLWSLFLWEVKRVWILLLYESQSPLSPLSSLGENEQYMKSLFLCAALPSTRSRSSFYLPFTFARIFCTSYNLAVSPPTLCSVSSLSAVCTWCIHLERCARLRVYAPVCIRASINVYRPTNPFTLLSLSLPLYMHYIACTDRKHNSSYSLLLYSQRCESSSMTAIHQVIS